MKNFDFVALLMPILLTVGKEPAVTFLQSIFLKDVKLYKLIIAGLDYALSEGQIAALKTTTTIDDALISVIREIVVSSASSNGITL